MSEPIAQSRAMRETLSLALDVSGTPTTVLVLGETGAGKEHLARFLHRASPRAARPFSLLPCVALDLDAAAQALTHGGTVVFDEIADLTPQAQARLLLVLEQPRASRVIATSSRELSALVAAGQLRADLSYRLDVFPVRVPALRERPEDLALLAEALLTTAATALGRPALRLSGAAVAALSTQAFPGNVRELSNLLERAAVRARAPVLEAANLGLSPARPGSSLFPAALPVELFQLEQLAIAEALRRCSNNRTHAARLLGIGLRTLRQKLNGAPPRPLSPCAPLARPAFSAQVAA